MFSARVWLGLFLVAPVAFAVPILGDAALDSGGAPESGDTALVDTGSGGWDTAWHLDTGLDDCGSPESGDTGLVECADDKKPPEIVDLKKYPKDKDFPDIPKSVADVLVARCATCHASGSGRGNLQRYDRANKEFAPSTAPKAPQITLDEMLRRITQVEDQGKMPPPKGTASPAGTPLTPEQLKTLQDWLEKNGAKK